MAVEIISETNDESPLTHCLAYHRSCERPLGRKGLGWQPPECPWVKVGNLYLSVTTSGNRSWGPLLEQLYGEGKKRFTAMTGRHGRQAGGFGLDGKIVLNDVAEEHYQQDLVIQKEIKDKFAGDGQFKLQLVDVGRGTYTSKSQLTFRALCDLEKGYVVIFSWCFSIYSMYEFREESAPGYVGSHDDRTDFNQRSELHVATELSKKSVRNIVQETFKWVPRKIN